MPAWNDNDIGPCRGERIIDRAHVGARETVRIEAAAQRRRRENLVVIPVSETHIPIERLAEPDALLLRHWDGGVQHGEIDVVPFGRDVAEQRRHVLHRMRLHERDAITSRHAAIRSQRRASRPASVRADHGSSAARLMLTLDPAVPINARSDSATQPTILSTG